MKRFIRPIRIDGNAAYVPLTKGYESIIDIDCVDLVKNCNWCVKPGGRTYYAMSNKPRPDRGTFFMHGVILPSPNGFFIDHIDGNGLNNKRNNLRIVTHTQNMFNRRLRVDNASGFKGVFWHKHTKKWASEIVANKIRHHLGYFKTPEDAHAAYIAAAKKLHGEYRRIE